MHSRMESYDPASTTVSRIENYRQQNHGMFLHQGPPFCLSINADTNGQVLAFIGNVRI
jgi:hypothetical protein